jgi:hypothetical protein
MGSRRLSAFIAGRFFANSKKRGFRVLARAASRFREKVALFGFLLSFQPSALFFARERRALVGSPWAFPSRMC